MSEDMEKTKPTLLFSRLTSCISSLLSCYSSVESAANLNPNYTLDIIGMDYMLLLFSNRSPIFFMDCMFYMHFIWPYEVVFLFFFFNVKLLVS